MGFMGVHRSSPPDVFLGKGALKICNKFTGEHPCRSVISIKLLCNFIEIALRHGCSPVDLLHIFRTPFPRNSSGWLLLESSLSSREKFRGKYNLSKITQTIVFESSPLTSIFESFAFFVEIKTAGSRLYAYYKENRSEMIFRKL